MITKGRHIAATLAICALGTQAQVHTAAPADTFSLNEVTVTAIKQSSNLRNQAVSSTRLSRRDIEQELVLSPKDASSLVPNLFMPDYGSRMTSSIYLRGLGTRIDNPTMGLSIDNIPIMAKENFDIDLPDMAGIETLRGPQGTLFGRNTIAGVMNVYTLSPLEYQGTRVLGQYASYNAYRAGVSHYSRPKYNMGFSAGAYFDSTDGHFTNEYNGRKCDWEHQGNARLKWQWFDPCDGTLSIENTLMFSMTRQGGYPYEQLATGNIAYNDTCFYHRTSLLDGLTVQKKFATFTLSGITSYQYLDDNMTLDQDFTPQPYFTLTQKRKEHAFTQDVVARSRGERAYRWLAGAFGFYRHYNMQAPVTFKDTGISELIEKHRNEANPSYPIAWDTREFVLGSSFKCPTWGVALYHQSQYFVKNVELAAGIRFDYERSSLNYHSVTHTGYDVTQQSTGQLFAHVPIDIDTRGRLHKDFFQCLPRVSATWNVPREMPMSLYAVVSKGSKAGGFNTQMFSDVLQQQLMAVMGLAAAYDVDKIVSYKPERAWNYEVGGHFECWKSRVKSDLAVFYTSCADCQLTVFPSGTTTGRVMTNAGKVASMGAELSFTLTPDRGTTMAVSYGYTHAKFLRYNNGITSFHGKRLPYSPAHTFYAMLSHAFPIHGTSLCNAITPMVDVRGAGSIYWNEANTLRQPFYALMGAGVTIQGRHYTLQLWGRNLTGTHYGTFYFESISHAFIQRGKPRTLGATLRVHF